MFYFIRESKPKRVDYSILTDLVLEGSDLIKAENEKINNDKEADGDFTLFIEKANNFLHILKESNEISENCEKYQGDIAYMPMMRRNECDGSDVSE